MASPTGEGPCATAAPSASTLAAHVAHYWSALDAEFYRHMCALLCAHHERTLLWFRQHIATLEKRLQKLERARDAVLVEMKQLRTRHRSLQGRVAEGASAPSKPCPATQAQQQAMVAEDQTTLESPALLAAVAQPSSPPSGPSPEIVTLAWRVSRFRHRVGVALGHTPLVSPSFSAEGTTCGEESLSIWSSCSSGGGALRANVPKWLQNSRLMIEPLIPRDHSHRSKAACQALVNKGPLEAILKVKVPNAAPGDMAIRVSVGNYVSAPMLHSFHSMPIANWHHAQLDWIGEITTNGHLQLSVDFLPHEAPRLQ